MTSQLGLPDFQSRNTGDFWTRKRVPMATNVVIVVVLVLLLGVLSRDGKEPSLLEFGSVRVLPNIRVRSVRVLSS